MSASLLLGLALAVGAPAPKDPPKKADPSHVGRWVLDRMVMGGQPLSAPPGLTIEFTTDGKVITRVAGQEEPRTTTVSVDAKKDPAEMDISDRGKVTRAIFKVDGDTLTVCTAAGDGPRPKAFESPAGSQVVLMVLKRAKKE